MCLHQLYETFQVHCSMLLVLALVLCVSALSSSTAGATSLTVTTIKQEPYLMSRGQHLEGYCYDLATELFGKLGLKFNIQLVKDNRFGALDEHGNWNGMIGEVVRGEADLALAPLTVTAVREQHVDMTKPFMQTGISFILRKDLPGDEGPFSLLSPFSTDLWWGIFVAFLLTGLCIYLVVRISPPEQTVPDSDEQRFSLLHSYWYIIGALTLQGAGPHPKTLSGRLVCVAWWLFVVLLLACFIASLSATLQSSQNRIVIKNFEDLANQDVIDYGTLKGSSTMMFFKNSNNPVYRRIYAHMEQKQSYVSNTSQGFQYAETGTFAFIGEAVSLDLAVARNCLLRNSQEVISMRSYSIAAPKGSPLVKDLSIAILELSESGKLAELKAKWWAGECQDAEKDHVTKTLQAHNLLGLFVLLGVGLGVGLLLALLEFMCEAHKQAKRGKKSFCLVVKSQLKQRFCDSRRSRE